MPGSEIRNGRKYLLFDDPDVQAYYDALFRLGEPDSRTPFDVNSAADLAKVGIIDPAAEGETENVVFPMQIDMERINQTKKVEVVSDRFGVLEGNPYAKATVLNLYSEKEKEAHARLKEQDFEQWQAELQKKEDFVTEGYLRHSIRRMMAGHVVLMDRQKKEYPRELSVKNGENGSAAELTDLPAEAPAEVPQEPEKPTLFGLVNLFYRMFGWGKGIVEPYLRSVEQYESAMADYREKDTARRAAANTWPEYAAEGKKVAPRDLSRLETAQSKLSDLSSVAKTAERNLVGLFGPKPEMKPGMNRFYQELIDSVDPAKTAVPVNGISTEQSAVFTHLAMLNPDTMEHFMRNSTIFRGVEHPIQRDRGCQLHTANGHLWDLQLGRDGMAIFAKPSPEGSSIAQGHALAKKAYEAWSGKDRDTSLMGKVLADGLPVFTQSLCRNGAGLRSDAYQATAWECEQIYAMLQEHPELREAAVQQGLPQEALKNLEAGHQIYALLRNGLAAEQKLLSGEKFSAQETRELLTDTMMMEYVNGVLMADDKAAGRITTGPKVDEARAFLTSVKNQGDEVIRRLTEAMEAATDTAEKDRLNEELNQAQQKHFRDVTLETGLITERLGSIIFNEPSSEKYRAFGDPAQLARMRENVKNSRAVSNLLRMAPRNRATELGNLIGKADSAEYNRLYMDLAGTVDGLVPAASASVKSGGAAVGVSGRVQEKQIGQKGAAVPGGHH